MCRFRFILRMRKVSSEHLLLIVTVKESNDSVSGQARLWSDCADVQADLGLRCPHMPKYTFSLVEAHRTVVFKNRNILVGFMSLSLLYMSTVNYGPCYKRRRISKSHFLRKRHILRMFGVPVILIVQWLPVVPKLKRPVINWTNRNHMLCRRRFSFLLGNVDK